MKLKRNKLLQYDLLPGSAGKLLLEEIFFFFCFALKVKLVTKGATQP